MKKSIASEQLAAVSFTYEDLENESEKIGVFNAVLLKSPSYKLSEKESVDELDEFEVLETTAPETTATETSASETEVTETTVPETEVTETVAPETVETVEENFVVEAVYTEEEKYWLEKITEAEAGNQELAGRIAIANIVLNRVAKEGFPDTIKEVIFQAGQFTPVITGTIYELEPDEDTIKAVELALAGECAIPADVIAFCVAGSEDEWFKTREFWGGIGDHNFYY